jgi:parallel beta-helix repeat protein
MMKKIIVVISLLVLLSCLPSVRLSSVKLEASSSYPVHNLNTLKDYATIQEAINASETLDNHTIFVEEGIYHEHVFVNKSLSLVGANRENTAIDAGGVGPVIQVIASGVNISNFRIQNGGNLSLLDSGIFVNCSVNDIFSNNTIQNSCGGIILLESNRNTLVNNTISNTGAALVVYNSNESLIADNIMLDNYYSGISIGNSTKNTLKNNSMINCSYSLGVGGYPLEHYLHTIETSNTVDGKPVYYLINQTNLTVNPSTFPEVGYLAIVNSTNVVVANLTLTRSGQCILFAYTSNSTIKNVAVSNSSEGIALHNAANSTVTGNNVSDCFFGIYLSNSYQNSLKNNIVSNSELAAIALRDSSMNFIVGNNASNDYRCIDLIDSRDNIIHHNNFVNYSETYIDDPVNVWDDGVEGNYWSSYTGTDSDHDGIGDTPYIMNSYSPNNNDSHPLMGMYHSFAVTIEGGAQYDVQVVSNSSVRDLQVLVWLSSPTPYIQPGQKFMRLFVFGLNGTEGFCRLATPRIVLNSTTYTVFLDGNSIPVNELTVSNGTHVYLYFAYQHTEHEVIIVPEFPSFLILLLFMIATLLAVIVYRKKPSFNFGSNLNPIETQEKREKLKFTFAF